MPRHAFVALLLAGPVGCADNNGGMDPPRGIDVLPATSEISLVTGAAGTVSVALKRRGGYTGEVALSVDATPTGVTATFEPPTLPNGTTSSVLTLRVASTGAAGSAPITVRAAGPGVADRTATIQVTITRPPTSTGAFTWKFCNPIDRTIWLAVQDGTTGVWKQIIGAADTYQFDLVQPTGGVAWVREPVPGNYVTTVFYGTAGEIAEFGANDCRGRTATTKVRAVALILTSAYAGGAAWDATIPDLTAAGWDPIWGLRPGVETGTFFSAEGSTFPTGVPSGAIDRGIVTSASRITLPTGSADDNSKHRDLMLSPFRNNAWFRSLLRPKD